MFKGLNENRMIAQARAHGKSHTPFMELIILFILMLITSQIMGVALMPALFFLFYSDPQIAELMMSGTADYNVLVEKMYNLLLNPPEWMNILSLFLTLVIIFGAVIYCTKIEKRPATSMGFVKRGVLPEYLVGLVLGALMMGAVVLLSVFSGVVTYNGVADFNIIVVVFYFIGYLIQGMAEETLFRGYYMVSSAENTSLVYSLTMSSLVFAFAHFANNGVTFLGILNVFLFGLFAGIYVLRRGSLWGIGALHAAWNFTQGILFGFNVSGNTSNAGILKFTQAEGFDSLNGGAFGPEGGMFTTLVLFIAIGVLLAVNPKKSELLEHDGSKTNINKEV